MLREHAGHSHVLCYMYQPQLIGKIYRPHALQARPIDGTPSADVSVSAARLSACTREQELATNKARSPVAQHAAVVQY